jgi:chromosome condensin MukBEF ATPase and DNA-binding subunit MukB
LEGDDFAYCSTCVDNLKLEAEFKLQAGKKRVEELETMLENQGELEASIASMTAEVEENRQTKKELQSSVQTLELEKSKLAAELASWHALEVSINHLCGQVETLQQSYIRDVGKLLGILLEVQNALTQRQNGNLLQRAKLALMGRTGRRSKAPGSPCTSNGETRQSEMVLHSGKDTVAREAETSRKNHITKIRK